MKGWIRLQRSLIDWGWSDNPEMVALWIHLLLRANYTQKEWHGVTIERGQLITGREQLSEVTGISERSIRTFLNRLVKGGEITLKSTNKFTIITICKYDKYQCDESQSDQQVTSNRPASDQQVTTTKKRKEYKNDNNYYRRLTKKVNDLWEDSS